MTTFNVIKNINEIFFVLVSDDFVENNPPPDTLYTFFQIHDTISVDADTPITNPPGMAIFALGASQIYIPAADVLTIGPVPHSFDIVAETRTIVQGYPSRGIGIEGATVGVVWIGTETTGGEVTGRYKNWFPFTVNIAVSTQIVSAIFSLTLVQTQGVAGVRIGCDNRGNSAVPTTYDDLNIITMTPSFITVNSFGSTVGRTYDYNITAAVQDVLNTTTTATPWTSGGTLGVIVSGTYDTTGARWVATYGNGTYAVPHLEITTA